jgi:hypothetical protein
MILLVVYRSHTIFTLKASDDVAVSGDVQQ